MADPTEPAIGISLDCKINDRRALVIQTHVSRDAPNGEVYHILEKCLNAADLLDIRYRLKDLRLLLDKTREELPMHMSSINEAIVGASSSSRMQSSRALII